jgi:hypothetical protein
LYQFVYEQPIYPRNLYLERPLFTHLEFRKPMIDKRITLMHERGIWRGPGFS